MTDETRAKVESRSLRTSTTESTWPPATSTAITPASSPSPCLLLIPPYLAELANRTIRAARQRDYSVYVTTYAEGSAKGARDLLKKFNSTGVRWHDPFH